MKRIYILKEVFQLMHQQILDKYYLAGYQPKNKVAELYGFDLAKEANNTIKGVMLQNSKVTDFISKAFKNQIFYKPEDVNSQIPDRIKVHLNGKYLYDRKLDYEKKKMGSVRFTGIYANIYFLFLGHKGIEQFLEAEIAHLTPQTIDKQKAILESGQNALSSLATLYKGFYYNYRLDKIKSFYLKIDFINNLFTEQWGFHVVDDSPTSTNIFEGKGIRQNGCICFLLTPKEGRKNQTPISIIAYTGGMEAQKMRIIRASFSTISAHGYPFCGETFLVKVREGNEDMKISDEELLKVRRYLFLQRRSFRVPPRTEQNLSVLTARRFHVDEISHMVGVWRVWSFSKNQKFILQSKFEVKPDYQAYLRTIGTTFTEQEQVCIIRLHRGQNGISLYVSAYQSIGTLPLNFAIIKVPQYPLPQDFDENPITQGVFSGIGINPGYLSGHIALYKEKPNAIINPEGIKTMEIENQINYGDYHPPHYKKMFQLLHLLNSGKNKNRY